MALPDSVNTTYVANSTPAIKAADLNQLQQVAVDRNRDVRGLHAVLIDDFFGNVASTLFWATATGVTNTDDSAAGAVGSVKLTSPATATLATSVLNVGTRDWRIAFQCRITASTGGGSINVGLTSPTTANNTYFAMASSSGTWRKIVGSVSTDLTIAPSTSYHTFEIRREANRLSFLYDGVEQSSENYTASQSDVTLTVTTTYATSGIVFLDRIKFWNSYL